MVLEQTIQQRLRYIFHYDELTWMPGVSDRPFNEMKIPYAMRKTFLGWLDTHTSGNVYIWPGVMSPDPHQQNWGHLVSPDGETAFIIFDKEDDQTRFSLEFVGSPDALSANTHKNGLAAYYNRKR